MARMQLAGREVAQESMLAEAGGLSTQYSCYMCMCVQGLIAHSEAVPLLA